MATPTTEKFHVRQDLSLSFAKFTSKADAAGHVAHRLFPMVTRPLPDGLFPAYETADLIGTVAQDRETGGGYAFDSLEWQDDSYRTKGVGLSAAIDRETAQRYGSVANAERFESARLLTAVQRQFEIETVDYITAPTSHDVSRVHLDLIAWTEDNATPLEDLDEPRKLIAEEFGHEPNALVIGSADFRALQRTNEIRDRIGTNPTRQAIAELLDLEEIVIARSRKLEPVSKTTVPIWQAGRAILAYVPTTDDLDEPSYGRTVIWDARGEQEGDRLGAVIESWDSPVNDSLAVRAKSHWGRKVVAPEAAHLLYIDGATEAS